MEDSKFTIISLKSWTKDRLSHTSLNQIVQEIKKSFAFLNGILSDGNKEIVFVINLDDTYTDRSDVLNFEGVELLKWLRLNKILNHCILLAFEPVIEIVQANTNNIILTSKGNSFIQLPEVVKLSSVQAKSSYFHANEIEIKQLFRSEIDIAVIRHEEANWWGVYKLAKAYQIVEDKNLGDIVKLLPPKLIQVLNSYSFQRNLFVFDTLEALDDVEIEEEEQTLLKNREGRDFLKEANPKIIYVDDQSEDGWSNILKEIIYQSQVAENFITPEVKDKSIEKIYDEIKIQLTNEFIDLIILDLRLKNEKGVINDIKQLSGVQLFEKIKSNYRKVPVLIITASNKSNTYAYLHSGGGQPDAYWIKEGIDSYYSNSESVNNYLDLVFKIAAKVKERRAGYLSQATVRNFETEQEKITAVKRYNEGLTRINFYSRDWVNNNIGKYSQIEKLVLFDVCIIDTNYLLYSGDNSNDFIQSFLLLTDIYRINNRQISIHLNVTAEIIKHGMKYGNNLTTIAARNLFRIIRDLSKADGINIISPETANYTEVITGKYIYADDKLVEYAQSCYLAGKSVLFITNDRGDKVNKGPFPILNAWFKNNHKHGVNHKVTGRNFIFQTMQQMLDDLKNYSINQNSK